MRAYEFVLPEHVTDSDFETTLARHFGGFTYWRGAGAWQGPTGLEFEKVVIFRIAIAWRDIVRGKETMLFTLVMSQARMRGEKALYYGPAGSPGVHSTGN